MKNVWTISDLDPRKLFEVVPNQDIETSVRFAIPVPNWLNTDGSPQFQHDAIQSYKGKDERRFHFQNFKDGAQQGVKIDGSGVIFFASPTPGQAQKLEFIVKDCADDLDRMTPDQLQRILDRSYSEIGLLDRYNGNKSGDIDKKMQRPNGYNANHPHFGSFVYKAVVSSCIYVPVDGEFRDGPTITPQILNGGGFIVFPGQPTRSVKDLIRNYDPENPPTPRPDVKVVATPTFLESRRDINQRPIDMTNIPTQDKQLKKIYKPSPISGFPEWTPEIRAVEQQWLRTVEETFRLYGFTNIETPAVEAVPVLVAKGEDVDKEIYGLRRLKEDPSEVAKKGSEPDLALHFDLTVPMARYVAQHYDKLDFPFKRYQMQKVWRGDRPQQGRFREFYQCDIDVIDHGEPSLEFDAEFPVIMSNLVSKLGIGNVAIGVNNRKVLQGFYQGLGLDEEQIVQAIRIVDKIDKIGPDGVETMMRDDMGLDQKVIEKCLDLAKVKETGVGVTEKVMALGLDTPLLREGLKELDFVMGRVGSLPKGSVVADLSIARGLDYYTGTVFEGRFTDQPGFGAILAGGRYDNLVSNFMNRNLPGVGISFGLTRVFSKMVNEGRINPGPKTPTQALIAVTDDATRVIARQLADDLRGRGIATEVYQEPKEKLGKQLTYANKKGIPYVVFPDVNGNDHEIKDMRDGSQKKFSIDAWAPK